LYFSAWNDFPGALIKRMMKTVNNQWILDMLSWFTDRKVTAVCCVWMYDGEKLISVTGSIEGTASLTVRWDPRFARDQIFIPNGYDKTFAEMTPEEKNQISMRKIAFEKMKDVLSI
jgi:XTP/dITP diphosphohydrolase